MWMVFAAFLFGVLVGGVANLVGADLPGRGAPTGPHCPYCGQGRPWWQWLGLTAYLVGRAQCPSCGASIGIHGPLIEIGLGLAYGHLWITLGPSIKLMFYSLYSAIFALIVATDIERHLILNMVTYPAMVLGFVASFFVPGVTWRSALTGGAIGLTFFFLAAVIGDAACGSGAPGGGDVRLAAFIGLITGYPLVIEAIVLAILIGATVSLVLPITRARSVTDDVPYGPFLIAGAMITLLWGDGVAQWFLP
ncbi:MAG: A24 family peptidase [Anaerolineae bacterium]|jgi:leader peptidase (prepilin peptidase)/N-methyltransferase